LNIFFYPVKIFKVVSNVYSRKRINMSGRKVRDTTELTEEDKAQLVAQVLRQREYERERYRKNREVRQQKARGYYHAKRKEQHPEEAPAQPPAADPKN
jgi:malate synthase